MEIILEQSPHARLIEITDSPDQEPHYEVREIVTVPRRRLKVVNSDDIIIFPEHAVETGNNAEYYNLEAALHSFDILNQKHERKSY